ncbi:hypothetical protein B0T19DRAFT_395620 [Cercophora scortea]|uniref:Uncharacterized protein n=1 Tax=Cercophora scortea TaxID=314031 RepID=A0AAE0J3Y8_9PEZI|nr:hypothetical protein B0T19DRAFT_395620 [Cercophora scortea]
MQSQLARRAGLGNARPLLQIFITSHRSRYIPRRVLSGMTHGFKEIDEWKRSHAKLEPSEKPRKWTIFDLKCYTPINKTSHLGSPKSDDIPITPAALEYIAKLLAQIHLLRRNANRKNKPESVQQQPQPTAAGVPEPAARTEDPIPVPREKARRVRQDDGEHKRREKPTAVRQEPKPEADPQLAAASGGDEDPIPAPDTDNNPVPPEYPRHLPMFLGGGLY